MSSGFINHFLRCRVLLFPPRKGQASSHPHLLASSSGVANPNLVTIQFSDPGYVSALKDVPFTPARLPQDNFQSSTTEP
ncbi:hypothetical protein DSO57_1023243 [Entomophthora muscae]|uniref:Uncharacterized protein n=1 Tax=Entomophthora muscae TaxID=34485 RepID=A0ACC2RHK5_9FUNG|nr:hypothetical protein DSO57_1023243 [Entomophthora muscae]